ncbi:hypothetical protein [Altererythrobacter sp. GH1-8]|uniref:hypothetical protein n=1 Tax=Altererythrobacter sp. GH1-8 TaxID=3349333 RepID=UPI00374CC290
MHDPVRLLPVIQENIWIIMSHALGLPVVNSFFTENYVGEFKGIGKLMERGNQRASRALLELGAQFRILDDADGLGSRLANQRSLRLGHVIQANQSKTPLYLRDMTNKILHSSAFSFGLDQGSDPIITCHSREPYRWRQADIRVYGLMDLAGMFP